MPSTIAEYLLNQPIENVLGLPFVAQSAIGIATAGVTVENNGAEFGPDTPGSTTTGIAEAVNAAYNTNIVDVYFIPNGISNFNDTITLNTPIRLRSAMLNGNPYGPPPSPTLPSSYLNYTGNVDGIRVYDSPSVPTGYSLCTKVILDGICVVANTQGASLGSAVHFAGGQRRCALRDCFLVNNSTSTNSFGYLMDTQLIAKNGEDNSAWNTDFYGNYAAVGLGISDVGQNTNNCYWYFCTVGSQNTGSNGYGVYQNSGGQHIWTGFYDRSNAVSSSYRINGGSATLYGMEQQNRNGYTIDVEGGDLELSVSRLTEASGPGVLVNGGNFLLSGHGNASGGAKITINGGSAWYSQEYNSSGNLSIHGSGGTLYLPFTYVNIFGNPDISSYSGSVVYYLTPGNIARSISSPVLVGTTSTQIASVSPNDSRVYTVQLSVSCVANATLTSLSITYTDISIDSSVTYTVATNQAMIAGNLYPFPNVPIPATNATDIVITAQANTTNALYVNYNVQAN
jgi:hypothetical protein